MRWVRDTALALVIGLILLLIQAYAGTDLVTATWRALAVALVVAIGAAYLNRRQGANHGRAQRLGAALHVERRTQTFQAEKAAYTRLGTILGFACTNITTEPLKNVRVRLDALQLKQGEEWVTPTWFLPQFLEWEDGNDSTDLAPTEELTCLLVRHDAKWVVFAHIPFANRGGTPYGLESGLWKAKLSLRASAFEPLIVDQDFEVERYPNPNVHAGDLRFAE